MKLGILGSTGQAGQRIVRYLSLEGTHELTLLGRNESKLRDVHASLSANSKGPLQWRVIDLSDEQSLRDAFTPLDMVIIALSSPECLPAILHAAVETKTDCFDILLSSQTKHDLLRAQEATILKAGLCYITDGGYHPGLPAALVRYAQIRCPEMTHAEVYGSFGLNWKNLTLSHETLTDFLKELISMDMSAYHNGRWTSSLSNVKTHSFHPMVGTKQCVAMGLAEMKMLPATIPTLRQAGFYIAGFSRLIDYVALPLCLGIAKAFPPAIPFLARCFSLALQRFASSERPWALLDFTGRDSVSALGIALSYPDPYDLTALPVVACIRQHAVQPRRSGLWLQAHYVAPTRFFEDLKNLGVEIKETRSFRS